MDDFKNLDNAQNVEIIANIFANNKPISELKSDDPQCIILVGAPGVGKTTQMERYLSELGYDYNKFYNISLDSIVEKVKPYRNTTMRVYRALKDKKTNLNDTNFGILNGIYLPTIMSYNTNLSLATTEKKMMKKIANRYTLKNGGGKRKRVNQKSLKKWTAEDWGRDIPKGRYLPKMIRGQLSRKDYMRTSIAKIKGKTQYVKQPEDIVKKIRKIKENVKTNLSRRQSTKKRQ